MQLTDWVRREIVRGRFAPGSRLPDRDWFMRAFATNRQLVQKAFDELKAEGFVRAVSGHGTRVADPLPFHNRYLLIVKGAELDAGTYLCAPALGRAAKKVAHRQDVVFDIERLADAPVDSVDYQAMLSRVRRHAYAGVFVQGYVRGDNLDTVMNVDDVPGLFIGQRNELTQGSLMSELVGIIDARRQIETKLYEACWRAGKRQVATFMPLPFSRCPDSFARMAEAVAAAGLSLVPNGYLSVAMDKWDEPVFRQLVRLFFCSDAGRAAEAVVLGDDNFLKPFAEELEACCGREGRSRYFISCLGNFPNCPKTELPVEFHGIDWEATLSAFIDYCSQCRVDGKRHEAPQVVLI